MMSELCFEAVVPNTNMKVGNLCDDDFIDKLASCPSTTARSVKRTKQMKATQEQKKQKRVSKERTRTRTPLPPLPAMANAPPAATTITTPPPPPLPPTTVIASSRNTEKPSKRFRHVETPLLNEFNDDIVRRYIANRKRAVNEDIETDKRELETLRNKQTDDEGELEQVEKQLQS